MGCTNKFLQALRWCKLCYQVWENCGYRQCTEKGWQQIIPVCVGFKSSGQISLDPPKQCQRCSESLAEALAASSLKHKEIPPVLTAGLGERAKGETVPAGSINSHSSSFIAITMGSLGSWVSAGTWAKQFFQALKATTNMENVLFLECWCFWRLKLYRFIFF